MYKFDKSQINQAAETPQVQNFIGVYQDNSFMNTQRVTRSTRKKARSDSRNREVIFSDSSNKEESKGEKKRHKKEKRKRLEYSNSDSLSNEKALQKEGSSEYSSVKLFKIEKI